MTTDSNKVIKKIAVGLLLLLLLPGNIYLAYRWLGAGRPAPGVEPVLTRPAYQDLSREYYQLNKKWRGKKVVVFLGDSITKRFNLAEYFPGLPLLNRGIFHDTTVGLLSRLSGSLAGLTPEKVFILIGYNDLALRDNREIVANLAKILGRIKAGRVYLQSILPVSSARPELNRRIDEINAGLRKLCAERGCVFLDIHADFAAPGGGIKPHLTSDGVHPNGNGYRLWSEALIPALAH